jgi:hypothetical protein
MRYSDRYTCTAQYKSHRRAKQNIRQKDMEIETQRDIFTKDNNAFKGIYNTSAHLSDKDKLLASYIVEKSSRLSAAVLLITVRNKGQHTLMQELEGSAVRLVLYASQTHESDIKREQFLAEISTLITLLDVGQRVGRVGPSNAELLTQELTALQRYVGEIEWSRGNIFLTRGELQVTQPPEVQVRDNTYGGNTRIVGQIKDIQSVPSQGKETGLYETQGHIEKDARTTPVRHASERMQDAQKDRRATILGMLQRKDRVSVRDVASVIKDCSEKTLQRELLALVAQGVLVKDGERRWSTYRLA